MTTKTCPFKQGFAPTNQFTPIFVDPALKRCDGENCQLWIQVYRRYVNGVDTYHGCGLIQHIPWKFEADDEHKEELRDANTSTN